MGPDNPHHRCGPDRCRWTGLPSGSLAARRAERGANLRVRLPSGREIRFPGCPAAHLTPEVQEWLEGYLWLSRFGRTPVDLGLLSADEMDPRWYEAQMVIDAEVRRIQQEEIERAHARSESTSWRSGRSS